MHDLGPISSFVLSMQSYIFISGAGIILPSVVIGEGGIGSPVFAVLVASRYPNKDPYLVEPFPLDSSRPPKGSSR